MTTCTPAPTRADARTRDLPFETTGTAAKRHRRAISTIDAAIASGRLPAYRVIRADGRPMYLVRPEDTDQLWGRPADLPEALPA